MVEKVWVGGNFFGTQRPARITKGAKMRHKRLGDGVEAQKNSPGEIPGELAKWASA
jgi:hypothetical protein